MRAAKIDGNGSDVKNETIVNDALLLPPISAQLSIACIAVFLA